MAIEWSDDIVLSELSDEPMLSEELTAIADRIAAAEPEKTPHVVLNLGRVSYLNSSNLAQLLRIRKLLAATGQTLKLCAVTEEVWSVMMVTGLDKVFRFAPDPMTALAGIQLEDEAREG